MLSPIRACLAVTFLAQLSACGSLPPGDRGPDAIIPGRTTERHVRVGKWTRSYLLHVPQRMPRNYLLRAEPFPLVLVLHGSGAQGESIRNQSGMDSLAEANHFIVAYPDGSGEIFGLNSDWNAGECCGGAHFDHVDDVAFLRSIISDLSARLPVDQRRIYVAGFSDGARMTYRAGCEMADQLAAIAAVAGNLVDAHCSPARPIPLIAFHGTSDNEVPFNDSAYTRPSLAVPQNARSLPSSIQFWLANDRCRDASERRAGPRVVVHSGVGCAADVVFYTLEGSNHQWPSMQLTRFASAVSASQLIARFFLRHSR